ncbi:MAG: asparagine--tRNA ligase, partial [Flavobacteriaceae bacterium]|nr:asparagine--tRNA ligase [Flavobacteriaceae bacterium]
MTVKDLFLNTPISKTIKVQGWVKTFRANRFISLNDGSTFQSIQCVVDFENTDNEILNNINSGA